jgi:hypothetical protein
VFFRPLFGELCSLTCQTCFGPPLAPRNELAAGLFLVPATYCARTSLPGKIMSPTLHQASMRSLRPAPFLPLRYLLKAEDMPLAELYVLGMGSPHPALGSPGGNWGTGSPVPPIECRASFLRLILSGFRCVAACAARVGLQPKAASSPSRHRPSTDCTSSIRVGAGLDFRSRSALARSCGSDPSNQPSR